MKRVAVTPRPNWQQIVESQGMPFYMTGDQLYWDESVCYQFTAAQISEIEMATYELDKMCQQIVEHVIANNLWDRFDIPVEFASLIKVSWETDERTIYGRFDLAYNGDGPPKLLEYNADTPTALLEAAVIQWFWYKDVKSYHAGADQFNTIHERLIEAWRALKQEVSGTLYFTGLNSPDEDYVTTGYLRDTAIQASFETEWIRIEDIGWNAKQQCFTDLREQPINCIFKLYPWEWLIREQFGQHVRFNTTRWLEAPWKMVLSNKAILPLLYQLFPNSPYLLRADWQPFGDTYVRKPLLAREGNNITIMRDGQTVLETGGDYDASRSIYQELYELPQFDGYFPVIGSWMVNGWACGIGIREDKSPVTSNLSRFIPHYFS